jgi:hypothetical protein
MMPFAYMTNEVYLELVPKFCEGIRSMPIVNCYLDWWVMILLDGYGSNANVHEAESWIESHW